MKAKPKPRSIPVRGATDGSRRLHAPAEALAPVCRASWRGCLDSAARLAADCDDCCHYRERRSVVWLIGSLALVRVFRDVAALPADTDGHVWPVSGSSRLACRAHGAASGLPPRCSSTSIASPQM